MIGRVVSTVLKYMDHGFPPQAKKNAPLSPLSAALVRLLCPISNPSLNPPAQKTAYSSRPSVVSLAPKGMIELSSKYGTHLFHWCRFRNENGAPKYSTQYSQPNPACVSSSLDSSSRSYYNKVYDASEFSVQRTSNRRPHPPSCGIGAKIYGRFSRHASLITGVSRASPCKAISAAVKEARRRTR